MPDLLLISIVINYLTEVIIVGQSRGWSKTACKKVVDKDLRSLHLNKLDVLVYSKWEDQ